MVGYCMDSDDIGWYVKVWCGGLFLFVVGLSGCFVDNLILGVINICYGQMKFDIFIQVNVCFENLKVLLVEYDLMMNDLVDFICYLIQMNDYMEFVVVFNCVFEGYDFLLWIIVGVVLLLDFYLCVEIKVVVEL